MTPDWHDFFGTIAQVAVTAFSVMFVALQVRSGAWRERTLRVIAAVAALVELFVPLLAALITVTGAHPWRLAALIASGLGLGIVARHAWLYRDHKDDSDTDDFDRKQAWGALLSLAIYSSILVAAFLPTTAGLYLLASASIWLLFSGSFEAF